MYDGSRHLLGKAGAKLSSRLTHNKARGTKSGGALYCRAVGVTKPKIINHLKKKYFPLTCFINFLHTLHNVSFKKISLVCMQLHKCGKKPKREENQMGFKNMTDLKPI